MGTGKKGVGSRLTEDEYRATSAVAHALARDRHIHREGEKRYWFHIALGRDLVSGSVDVLRTQLEEVSE